MAKAKKVTMQELRKLQRKFDPSDRVIECQYDGGWYIDNAESVISHRDRYVARAMAAAALRVAIEAAK